MQKHIPVLPRETIKYLNPRPNENFIDATLGYGGHSQLILEKTLPNGQLLAIDQDEMALVEAQKNLAKYAGRIQFVQANFAELGLIVRKWPVKAIDGILLDLGVNTEQLTGSGGFSFQTDALLDMRLNRQRQRLSAADIVNKYAEKELIQVFRDLGEERFTLQIAKKIIEKRYSKPIATTAQLVEIIKEATPPSYRFNRKTHFATNIFRALRMEVNQELENLQNILPQAAQVLSPGGRLAIITFHSLEDRIVKNFFRSRADLEVITTKPIVASLAEVNQNPSARSAKLRVAKKSNY